MRIEEISTGSTARSSEELREAALAQFYTAYPLAVHAQFYSHTGNADAPRKNGDQFNAGGTRTTGSDYAPKEREPQFGSVQLKIYGDKVQTDIAHERRGTDIGSQRLNDLEAFSESLGWYFADATINHDVSQSAQRFKGLKAQADTLGRNFVMNDGSGNGYALPADVTGANATKVARFFEKLDEYMGGIPGGPTVLGVNAAFAARLGSIGKSYLSVQNVQTPWGEEQKVTTYNGVPLVNMGYTSNGTGLVLPQTETVGTSNDCCSIYGIRFGEQRDVTFATNVGLDVQDLSLVGTKYLTLVEFDVDLAVLNPKAFFRMSGVRLNAN
ncbi:MAG: hypothetical protein IAE99_08240 [Rhodothermales bacterium]|nr:hypothetical protein [Rhodothermales bacterium]